MTQKSGVARWTATWTFPFCVGVFVLLAHGFAAFWWVSLNPFPDGSQNEYFHVGNAFDLWGALLSLDIWHLRYYTAHSYWPPGLVIAAWPSFAALGASHGALIATNFLWLALAFWGVAGICGEPRKAAVAIGILSVCPGVFGPLVRFEPNIAQLALTALALWLIQRDAIRTTRGALMLGAVLGVGLMTDRLGTVPLVLGALAWTLWTERDRFDWRALIWVGVPVLVIAGPWYLQWSQHQLMEVSSQLGIGEIDSAGHLTEGTTPFSLWSFVFYPLALFDSQAGPVLGLAMFIALFWRPRRGLQITVLVGWLLFTLVQKKQVFYTLPLLVPLSVLLADALYRLPVRHGRWGLGVLLLLGLHQFGGRQWGAGWPGHTVLGQAEPLPDSWVGARHKLAVPPSRLGFPFAELRGAIGGKGAVVVFSQSSAFFEGYIELGLRAQDLGRRVVTVRGNPLGVYEDFRHAHAFVVISDASTWPTEAELVRALVYDHYTLDTLPPLTQLMTRDAVNWRSSLQWELPTGDRLTVWIRAQNP